MKTVRSPIKAFTLIVLTAGWAAGSFALPLVEFTDLATYNSAVGAHQVITFEGLAVGTVLGNQFIGQGVTFSDGNDTVHPSSYFPDGIGVNGNGRISLTFSAPMNNIGAEFPGALVIDLYSGGSFVASSSQFAGSGSGFFGGVLDQGSTFDKVVLRDWVDDFVFIDNLHFGLTSGSVPDTGSTLMSLGFAAASLLGFGSSTAKR